MTINLIERDDIELYIPDSQTYSNHIREYFDDKKDMYTFFQGYFNLMEWQMFAADNPFAQLHGEDIHLRAFRSACVILNGGTNDAKYIPEFELIDDCLENLIDKITEEPQ